MAQAVRNDDDLAIPPDRPLTAVEKQFSNVAANGIGICAVSHMQMPVSMHQCIGPGVSAGVRYSVLQDVEDADEVGDA